ncbi:MAG: 50S ribosomal protein L23 [Coriobacteriia bacterium]|nr:50S ribosomal protein L23 [Coriobacteriia bacterium]
MNLQKDPREVIIRPVISERSYDMMEQGKYTFEVAKDSNKIEIADAIEKIFEVKVLKVNVSTVKPKPKRVRYVPGHTKTWKKAIVKLREGDSIELFGSNQ